MAAPAHRYEIDMCSGSILPKMLRFSIPLMVSGVLQLLFNAADIVVVGRFAGDNSLAAVGSNSSIINLLVNVFIGLSVGANILAARQYGAGQKEELRKTVHTAMLLGLISGIFLAVLGACCAGTFLRWMQSPPEVLPLATLYLRIYFLGMPATLVYNFGAALLRAVGDTQRPLYYLFAAGIINVALNLLFVIVFQMDVAGVALATIISQCVSALLVVRCMMRDSGAIHLELRQLRLHTPHLKQILRVGFPAGLQGSLFSLSNVFIQSSVNGFGEIAVAGVAACFSVESFIYTAMNSISQAAVSFVSQNYGARRYDRIIPVLWRAMVCVIVVGLTFSGTIMIFRYPILGLYTSSLPVVEYAIARLKIDCLPHFLCGMMEIMAGGVRGLGYSVLPMVVTLMGACAFRLLWVATIFQIPAFHTFQMLYVSYPISWALTLLVHTVCFIWAFRRLKRHAASEETEH